MSATEITNQTGIKYGTVYYYLNNKPGDNSGSEAVESGENADRKQCKTCRFRGKSNGCDYIAVVGRSRGCSVADCNVYEKGTPASKKKQTGFYGGK